MTQKITNILLSRGAIALGAAALLAPMHMNGQNGNFDYEMDDDVESGVHYEINPNTGQPQREYDGEKSAVEQMAGDFTDRYTTLDAEITGIRTVEVGEKTHTLAQARLQDGSAIVIDLGPRDNLADFNLQAGDTIRVRGLAQGEADDHLFVADRLYMNGETLRIGANIEEAIAMEGPQYDTSQTQQASTSTTNRDYEQQTTTSRNYGPQDRSTRTSRSFSSSREIQGEIVTLEEVDLQGQTHTVASIRLDNGRTILTDLGDSDNLGDLNEGDSIQLSGSSTRVDGAEVFVANSLRRQGGQPVRIAAAFEMDGETAMLQ